MALPVVVQSWAWEADILPVNYARITSEGIIPHPEGKEMVAVATLSACGFPIWRGDFGLPQKLLEERNVDVASMWIGNADFQGGFYHEGMLCSLNGTCKAEYFQPADKFPPGDLFRHVLLRGPSGACSRPAEVYRRRAA